MIVIGHCYPINQVPRPPPGPRVGPEDQGRDEDCQRYLPARIERQGTQRGQSSGCWSRCAEQGRPAGADGRVPGRQSVDSSGKPGYSYASVANWG